MQLGAEGTEKALFFPPSVPTTLAKDTLKQHVSLNALLSLKL